MELNLMGYYFIRPNMLFRRKNILKNNVFVFSVEGDLGNVDSGFALVFGDEWEKKKTFWMKKDNIGIIAKMATNIRIGKNLD